MLRVGIYNKKKVERHTIFILKVKCGMFIAPFSLKIGGSQISHSAFFFNF